ncbi:hypothetical protein MAR_038184 [Mya arenaria]|uniref:Transposase Helix-turn-helix domain-containing protein n=1 Tax=Mya arenaria TaxID=6604 RepID=A0ABY7FQM7_MYAAR|nr:hypothetical protein MAR_038184 [Mya arenaria]
MQLEILNQQRQHKDVNQVHMYIKPETCDVGFGTCKPEITIEDIQHSKEKIHGTGRKQKHRPIDEFLMVKMRLRLGLLVKDLEYRFKVASSTVFKRFHTWIIYMFRYLQSIVFLPELHVLQKRVPPCFSAFSDTRIVLDCTEIFVQRPSSLENQSLTYSNYESHNTF